MAIIPVHKRITKAVLKEFKFSDSACEIAATANALVDKKQGNSPDETHLHAMRGVVLDAWGNSVPEARALAVAETYKLVEKAKMALIEDVRRIVSTNGEQERLLRTRSAVESLGRTLHTVQDIEFHDFGLWCHAGMREALFREPFGLAMHGVHDLGNVEATFESASDQRGRYGVAVDVGIFPWRRMADTGVSVFQGAYMAGRGQRDSLVGIAGIRIGGGPSGVRKPSPRSGALGLSSGGLSLLSREGFGREGGASSGPVANVLNRAERSTRDFVRQILAATLLLPPNHRPWQEWIRLAAGLGKVSQMTR